MKTLGAVRQPDFAFDPPDYTIRAALSTVAAAIDFPTGGAHFMRMTALSSAAAPAEIFPYVSVGTTAAALPTTGVSSGSSAYFRALNSRLYRVASNTTGISALCEDSSGYLSIELWK